VVQGAYLKVYSQKAKLIATHRLSSGRGQIIINPEHYEGLKRKKIKDKDLLMKMFCQSFPDKAAFAERLVAANRMNAAYHLFRILDSLKYYSKEEVESAISKSTELNCYLSKYCNRDTSGRKSAKDGRCSKPGHQKEYTPGRYFQESFRIQSFWR